jgi:two-component system, chemotaxis family, chemotaxis protein CheY
MSFARHDTSANRPPAAAARGDFGDTLLLCDIGWASVYDSKLLFLTILSQFGGEVSEVKKILVVDDSTLSRMMIRNAINDKCPDCEIMEAASGEAALAQARDFQPDLITLDINMPGINGLEAAVQLHAENPQARLAIITANIQQSMRKKLQSLGIFFVAVIEKPATADNMQKILAIL